MSDQRVLRSNTPILVKRLDNELCSARFMGKDVATCQKKKGHEGPHLFIYQQDGNSMRVSWGNGSKVSQ